MINKFKLIKFSKSFNIYCSLFPFLARMLKRCPLNKDCNAYLKLLLRVLVKSKCNSFNWHWTQPADSIFPINSCYTTNTCLSLLPSQLIFRGVANSPIAFLSLWQNKWMCSWLVLSDWWRDRIQWQLDSFFFSYNQNLNLVLILFPKLLYKTIHSFI